MAQFGGGGPGNVSPRQAQTLLVHAPGVTGHSGPYPAAAILRSHGITAQVEAEGRDPGPASVDQPKLTQGSWVRGGGVVIERTFAGALGVRTGDSITLDGQPFRVAGLAVTAASPPYPNLCYVGCYVSLPPGTAPERGPGPGLIWVTQAEARTLAASAGEQLTYVLNLKLADSASASAFASAYNNNPHSIGAYYSWPAVQAADGLLVADGQQVLLVGSWLLGLLAVASVAVLAGGRMAEQTRRVGLLKAVGGTPGLVAAVLLAENLILALVATLVPAIRAARTSTVRALADAARPARRRAALIAVSAWLPVPLLLGLRLAARRPRRVVLSAASIAITVTGIVAVLAFHATADQKRFGGSSGLTNPVAVRDSQVLLIITVALVALAVLNAIVTTWAAVLDTRRSSALTRALGATPQQVSAGLSTAQLVPALPGAILGVPAGIALFKAANGAGITTVPPAWWLLAAVAGTLLAVGGLSAIPARIGARRPTAEILQSELG